MPSPRARLVAGRLHQHAKRRLVDLEARDLGAQHRLVAAGPPRRGQARRRQTGPAACGCERSPMPPIISRSCVSRYLAMVQPALSSPTRLRRGTLTLSKKVSQNGDLPEISMIGRVVTPGDVHVDQHEADAGVFLRGVGAHQAEDPVGLVGIGGPDLLAVDDEVVVVDLGAWWRARPGRSRHWARSSPGTSGFRRARSAAGVALLLLGAVLAAAPGPSIQMPKLCSGARQSSARISCAQDAPPAVRRGRRRRSSRGQLGTVQPRSPMRCIHGRCASDWNLKRLPPQQTSFSVLAGWRISGGQLASSQARVSRRKPSRLAFVSPAASVIELMHVSCDRASGRPQGCFPWQGQISNPNDGCRFFLDYKSRRNHTANSKTRQGPQRRRAGARSVRRRA